MRYTWLPVLLVNALSTQAAAQASALVTAFVDVSVVPMDRERVLAHQTVVVRGDRIIALGPAPKIRVPAGAQQIDGRGKYLIPGLADMHVHAFGVGKEEFDSTAFWRYLARGVTTVRDMHSRSEALRVKRAVASGALLGPRLYTAARIPENELKWREIHRGQGRPSLWVLDASSNVAAIADSIVAFKRAGHDFVKQYGLPHPVYDSVEAAARRVGLRIVGHVPAFTGAVPGVDVGVERVLQDRWASIEHVTGYFAYLTGGFPEGSVGAWFGHDSSMTDTAAWAQPGYQWDAVKMREIAVATRQAGVWNCPTLLGLRVRTQIFGGDTTKSAASWKRPTGGPSWLRSSVDFRFKMVKALQEAGAGLLLGTDDFGDAPDELRLFVEEAGLTPYQALATGTRNVAVFLGTLDSTGTVAVGKRADLLLLDGNPLQDIRATAAQTGVMVGGRWLARAELDARLPAAPR